MGPGKYSEILRLVFYLNIIFLIFRFLRGGRDDVVPSDVLVTWDSNKVLLNKFPSFQLSQSKLLLFSIWYNVEQESIPTSRVIKLLPIFKNLGLLVMSLGWLLCSTWWTSTLEGWLVWCGWGSAWVWTLLGWASRKTSSIRIMSVTWSMCHPSILVVY